MDTLAVRLAVPLTGSAEDFPFLGHFQGVRPAGRTKKKAAPSKYESIFRRGGSLWLCRLCQDHLLSRGQSDVN